MANEPSPPSQPDQAGDGYFSPPAYVPQGGYQPQPGYPPLQSQPQPSFPPGYPTPGYPTPGYGPPSYGPPTGYPPSEYPPAKKRGGLATAALVLGIIGLLLAVVPLLNFVAYPIVILAVIFGLFSFRWGKGKAGVILGILGLAATILWTVAIAGAFDNAVNKTHTVVYRVTGSGPVTHADVTYDSNEVSHTSSSTSAKNQILPFEKTVTIKGDFSDFVVTANTPVTASTSAGTLSCELLVDGKVVSTDKSDGALSLVSCSGTGYDGK